MKSLSEIKAARQNPDYFIGTTKEVIYITRPGERVICHVITKMFEKYGCGTIPAIKLIKEA